jgi:hypothetical protein
MYTAIEGLCHPWIPTRTPSLLAETGPCDLLVHYKDFSSSWNEMTISSDVSWDDFRHELADNLEIVSRKFRTYYLVVRWCKFSWQRNYRFGRQTLD